MKTNKIKICPKCNKEFTIKHSKQIFCSYKCSNSYRATGEYIKCLVCSNETWKELNRIRKFCSFKCYNIYRKGKMRGPIERKWLSAVCLICKETFRKYSISPKIYCSVSCSNSSRRGTLPEITKHDKFIEEYLIKLEKENPNIRTITTGLRKNPIPDGIIIDFESRTITGFEAQTEYIDAKKKGYLSPRGIDNTIFILVNGELL